MNHTRTHCVADMKLLHSSLGWINEMSEWAILVQWVFCGQLKVSYILHADELLFCTIFLFLKYTCLAVEILDNLSICRFFRCQRVVIVLPIRQKLSFFCYHFKFTISLWSCKAWIFGCILKHFLSALSSSDISLTHVSLKILVFHHFSPSVQAKQ